MQRKQAKSLLVVQSESMKAVLASIDALATSEDPVLIEGEPGSGREFVARCLHMQSHRRHRELVSIKASTLLSEVFGLSVESQAETAFQQARGSSLLVRDICDLRKGSQRKLSKILGPGNDHDVRVIATCDPGLSSAVQAGVFYEPLQRKLSQHTIVVPPVRERLEDIVPLMESMVASLCRDMGRKRLSMSVRATEALLRYPWPGNVAEMQQVARRLVVRAQEGRIEAGDVDAVLPTLAHRAPIEDLGFEDLVRSKLAEMLKQLEGYPVNSLHQEVMSLVEKPLLRLVMENTGANQLKAAEMLGLSRNTLRRKLLDFGLVDAGKPTLLRAKSTAKKAAAKRVTAKKSESAKKR